MVTQEHRVFAKEVAQAHARATNPRRHESIDRADYLWREWFAQYQILLLDSRESAINERLRLIHLYSRARQIVIGR